MFAALTQDFRCGALFALLGLLLVGCQSELEVVPEESPPVTAVPVTTELGAPAVDPATGFVVDDGWELVRAHCTACHSALLVTQNRGSRETWEHMIRWMQESQGLWAFDPMTENTILDYLARNYAPQARSRRPPLPPDALPPNPFAGAAGSSGP